MFELTISHEKNKANYMGFVYKKLKSLVDKSKGLIIFEEINGRSVISLAVPDDEKEMYKAFTFELVSEIMVMDYKYKFFKERIKRVSVSEPIWEAFMRALTIFDKQTDKELIVKDLVLGEELLVDSSYYFKMHEIKERWQAILELVEGNLLALVAADSLVDLIKFLLIASEYQSDKVYVKNCKNGPEVVIENTQRVRNLCFFDEEVDVKTRIISELVCVCPTSIIVELDSEKDSELINLITTIFGEKVHLKLDDKIDSKCDKEVDKKKNVGYNA